jgi:hypothetical protein
MMKKLILIAILTLGFAQATDNHTNYANKQAQKRVFKTPQEVHMKHHSTIKNHPNKKIVAHKNSRYYSDDSYRHGHRYHHNTRYSNRYGRYDMQPQRGYRHLKQSWFYAYRYGKADFVDRYGFYYGYFDRRGYMFEGEFYRYDRDYRYQDRLRGRGLFDRHIYYKPLPRIYRDELPTYRGYRR